MADYCSMFRTNYFKTDDEPRLRKILKAARLPVWTSEDPKTGRATFAFGAELQSVWDVADAEYMYLMHPEDAPDEDDEDWELDDSVFFDDLSDVVSLGDAIIITEIGWEKLRYLNAMAVIISKNGVEMTTLNEAAAELALTLGVGDDWNPRMDY